MPVDLFHLATHHASFFNMALKPKPKHKPGAKPSTKDLVKVGPRDVFVEADKAQKLREVKPTTSRALILRNNKQALQKNGEFGLMTRMSGREKLDLLAGKSAPKSPVVEAFFSMPHMQRTLLNGQLKLLLHRSTSKSVFMLPNRNTTVR
jgi:hypothetical protein